jgi:hypothetical protein
MADQLQSSSQPDFSGDIEAVAKQYPALSPYMGNAKVQYGDQAASAGRQLEFYPPWESDNPNPGAVTLELFQQMQGQPLQQAIAGDMLHLLGAVDPRTGQAVDPKWSQMRQQLIDSRTDKQRAMDQKVYRDEGDKRSFDDWINQSRADAYVRGYITPDAANEWQQVYTPDQVKILDQMRGYLTTPPPRSPQQQTIDFVRLLDQKFQISEKIKALRAANVVGAQ